MAKVVDNYKERPGYIITYYDIRGIRKRKVVHCSKREAEMLANEIEAKKTRIKLGFETEIGGNQLLSEAIIYYFRHKHKNIHTIKREKQIFYNLLKFIGNIRIRQITFAMIDEYLRKRFDVDKIKEATLGIEFRTLRAFFNYFADHNFISTSPMTKMKHPKVKSKKIRFLTEDEIKRLLEVIDDENYRDLVLMYLHTGARREELLKERLSWNDVDFDRRNCFDSLGNGKTVD